MIRRLLFVLTCGLSCGHLAAQTDTIAAPDTVRTVLMRDVFADMPQQIMPLVTKNNRLDCIDFIENNMKARVRNAIDDYVELEALSADFLRFRTSERAYIEMKLLQEGDSLIIALTHTVEAGNILDSHISFYTLGWRLLDSRPRFEPPSPEAFLPHEAVTDQQRQALMSLTDFHPVCLSFAHSEPVVECALQTSDLTPEQKQAFDYDFKTITLRWNGQRFE